MYTVDPDTNKAETEDSGAGFHVNNAAVVASTAAAYARAVAFTCENQPPKYTVEPETAIVKTALLGAGFHVDNAAFVASTAAA
jgi:hypothetical protein